MPDNVTLRDHFERLLAESDRRYEQRFTASEEALRMSANVLSEYKTASNEWRGALKDQASQMATRSELEKVSAEVQELRRAKANYDGRVMVFMGALSLSISMVVAFISRWFTQ